MWDGPCSVLNVVAMSLDHSAESRLLTGHSDENARNRSLWWQASQVAMTPPYEPPIVPTPAGLQIGY